LDCPGYGLILKWGQGVASRGKLAGKSIPVRYPDKTLFAQADTQICRTISPMVSPEITTSPLSSGIPKKRTLQDKLALKIPSSSRHMSDGHTYSDNDTTLSGHHDNSSSSALSCDGHWTSSSFDIFDRHNSIVSTVPSSIESPHSSTSAPHKHFKKLPILDLDNEISPQFLTFLHNEQTQTLLHHYDQAIAPMMVWIDGSDNPWRIIIIPLAEQSPTLLLSVLAVAAQHIANQIDDQDSMHSIAAITYRDTALQLITRRLMYEADISEYQFSALETAERLDSDATLAAIIILCTFELVESVDDAWHTHLNAARTMIKFRGGLMHDGTVEDRISTFLIKQALTLNTFAFVTEFTKSSNSEIGEYERCFWEDPTGGDLFESYLNLLQYITHLERRLHDPSENFTRVPHPEVLQLSFEDTRRRNVNYLSESLSIHQQQDYVNLFNAYHHAGLLYAWRGLYESENLGSSIVTSTNELYISLSLIKDTTKVAQDLIFPLFILGTEGSNNEDLQDFIIWRIKEIMVKTGFRNGKPVLDFLTLFWAVDDNRTWLDFARSYMVA